MGVCPLSRRLRDGIREPLGSSWRTARWSVGAVVPRAQGWERVRGRPIPAMEVTVTPFLSGPSVRPESTRGSRGRGVRRVSGAGVMLACRPGHPRRIASITPRPPLAQLLKRRVRVVARRGMAMLRHLRLPEFPRAPRTEHPPPRRFAASDAPRVESEAGILGADQVLHRELQRDRSGERHEPTVTRSGGGRNGCAASRCGRHSAHRRLRVAAGGVVRVACPGASSRNRIGTGLWGECR